MVGSTSIMKHWAIKQSSDSYQPRIVICTGPKGLANLTPMNMRVVQISLLLSKVDSAALFYFYLSLSRTLMLTVRVMRYHDLVMTSDTDALAVMGRCIQPSL